MIYLFLLIGCCLFTVYGALIEYYRQAWNAIPGFDAFEKTGHTRISVLIPVRNEAANIANCIQSLSLQSYSKGLFEVIVIDDHSTDTTASIVTSIQIPGLNLIYIPPTDLDPQHRAYKKMAIQTGVNAATGQLIVTTDADCRFHPDWLNTLAVFYEQKGARFIAAPVRMEDPDSRPSALAVFQMLDFITLQGITGAAVHRRFHSMCNGANLAYERTAFFEVGGFEDIDAIPSGDDMFLMHKIYTKYPDHVFFLKSPQAIVSTPPQNSWKGFVNQRVRWASKADRYEDKRIFRVLLLVYIVNALFLVLPVAACWNVRWLWLLLAGLVVKTVLEFPFVYKVSGFFGQRSLMCWFPVMQPFHIVYTVVIGWMGKFGSYRWKDRTVRK